ncbi:MAG: hypothetical protein QXW52_04320 [Candidatus Caldarchaeum sp.]
MLKDSLHYWSISAQNPEPLIDESYLVEVGVMEAQMEVIKRVRRIVRHVCEGRVFDDETLLQLVELLELDGSQYTEFAAYFNAFDLSLSAFNKLGTDARLRELRKVLRGFCERRFSLYKWVADDDMTIPQALIDKGASRAKGASSKQKVMRLARELYGLYEQADYKVFRRETRGVVDVDSLGSALTQAYSDLGLDAGLIKRPDLLIKLNGHVLVVEAKHIKEAGGAQDKQLLELCRFVRTRAGGDVHFVAFLDGFYANEFFEERHRYSSMARESLLRSPGNFFVNTNGLKVLLADLASL